jgi:hypothetical protein
MKSFLPALLLCLFLPLAAAFACGTNAVCAENSCLTLHDATICLSNAVDVAADRTAVTVQHTLHASPQLLSVVRQHLSAGTHHVSAVCLQATRQTTNILDSISAGVKDLSLQALHNVFYSFLARILGLLR